jgi:hypothetical protein
MRRAWPLSCLAPFVLAPLLAFTLGCAADIGDECDKSGSKDECVDGAICTQISDGTNACRKSCTDDTECGANEQCNGVSGANTKSCQPKK